MEFEAVVALRRSVRHFQQRDVEDGKLNRILEAARAAPSAGNLQAYSIVILRDQQRRRALCNACLAQPCVADAPVVICFCANPRLNAHKYRERGKVLYSVQDATIACSYAQLCATSIGLATCWIGAFRDDDVHAVLELPADERPVAVLPLGYSTHEASQPKEKRRRPLNDLVIRRL